MNNIEVTSLEETFPCINRHKYIGLCVKTQMSNFSDIIYIVHFSLVKKIFKKYIYLIRSDWKDLEETANWMNAYEDMCKAINKDILGIEIVKDNFYSMDLPRYLEELFHEEKNKKEIYQGNFTNVQQ